MVKLKINIKTGIEKFIIMILKIVVLSFLFIFVAMYFKQTDTINKKEVTISSNDIKYYMDIADSNSKPLKQLNWKEIAAVEDVVNSKFDTYNKDLSSKIANGFYDNNGNLKDLKVVMQDLNLSDNDIIKAYEILEQLNRESYSLRTLKIGKNNSKDDFIASLKEGSIEDYKEYGILPSISIAQAILESSWGESELASQYNNYYGIKADKSWTGAVAKFSTGENYDDKIVANFRAYNSPAESIADFCEFLKNNKRYRENGVFSAGNYREQAAALQKAGYSTAKDENGNLIYADMLIDIIKENNLMVIDAEAQRQ